MAVPGGWRAAAGRATRLRLRHVRQGCHQVSSYSVVETRFFALLNVLAWLNYKIPTNSSPQVPQSFAKTKIFRFKLKFHVSFYSPREIVNLDDDFVKNLPRLKTSTRYYQLFPASALLFIPVLGWPDAGRSGILKIYLKRGSLIRLQRTLGGAV